MQCRMYEVPAHGKVQSASRGRAHSWTQAGTDMKGMGELVDDGVHQG